MPDDIKSLLDSIIDSGEPGAPNGDVIANHHPHMHGHRPSVLSSDQIREKLSMCVLKDILCAMMHDDVKDMSQMIDDAIIRHIHDDYKGTCFSYLRDSRDRLNSPILSDIIQEIEDKSAKAVDEMRNYGRSKAVDDTEAITKELLGGVDNYEEFRANVSEKVTNKVVNDVAKDITKSNDAPVFDNIDQTLKKKDATTTESSVIMHMCGTIVTEAAIDGVQMSPEEGLQRSIITYCLGELDVLFKADPSRSIVRRYCK